MRATLVGLALLGAGAARAGDIEDYSLEELMGLVEAPTRHAEPVASTPLSVEVLTAEELHRLGTWTLPEALRYVAGVDVVQHSLDSYTVSIRGTNPNSSSNLVVLLDGHPLTSDVDGETHWAGLPVDLRDVERIEIVRGPTAVAYGTNAVTGVVNVVTARPESTGAVASVSGGHPMHAESRLRWDRAGDRSQTRVTALQRYSRWGMPEGTSTTRAAIDGQLWRAWHAADLALHFGSSIARPLVVSPLDPGGVRPSMLAMHQSADLSGVSFLASDKDQLHVRQSLKLDRREGKEGHSAIGGLSATQVDAEANWRVSPAPWTDWDLGASARFLSASSPSLHDGEVAMPLYAAWARQTLRAGDWLSVGAGGRLDYSAFARRGKVSGIFTVGLAPHANHHLRTSYGEGFRNPTLFEVAGEFRDRESGLAYLLGVGSEALRPLGVYTAEVGYRGRPWRGQTFDFAVYHSVFHDLIVQQHQNVPATFSNQGSYRAWGFEATTEWRPTRSVPIFAGYTWQEAPEGQLGHTPVHKAFAGAGVSVGRFDLHGRYRYASEATWATLVGVPAVLVNTTRSPHHDLGVTWTTRLPEYGVAVQVSGHHLLDLEPRPESPLPGASPLRPFILAEVTYDGRVGR